MTATGVSVLLGLHDRSLTVGAGRWVMMAVLTNLLSPRKLVAVTEVLLHPGYSAPTKENDMALLKIGKDQGGSKS